MRSRSGYKIFVLILALQAMVGMGNGQDVLKGKVMDQRTQEPVPFASLYFPGTNVGVFADLDGLFQLALPGDAKILEISMIGYEKKQVLLDTLNLEYLQILLKETPVELETVTILPDQDPARRIVKKVIKNRKFNDIQRQRAYHFVSYNKLKFWTEARDTARPGDPRVDSLLDQLDLLIWETVTQTDYKSPTQPREITLASRISGYPGRSFPLSPTDIQSLSFYSDYVEVIGESFLNPVSDPGLRAYNFTLEEVLIKGKDSVFTLSFEPKRPALRGFRGFLNVDSRGYAISNIDAELVLNGNEILIKSGEIKQLYTEADSTWRPSQLLTDLEVIDILPGLKRMGRISARSDLDFSPASLPIEKRQDLLGENVEIMERSLEETDSILQSIRGQELSAREEYSYRTIDSIGAESGIDRSLDRIFKLAQLKFPIGPLDLDFRRLLEDNWVENYRLGIGLMTNEKLSRIFSAGGYFGYGFRDKEMKYGGRVRFQPWKDDRLMISLEYDHDLLESGWDRISEHPLQALWFENKKDLTGRLSRVAAYEYTDRYGGFLHGKLPANISLMAGMYFEDIEPAFGYTYDDQLDFRFDQLEIKARWAPGQRLTRMDDQLFAGTSQFPILKLRFREGLAIREGSLPFRTIDGAIDHRFYSGNMSLIYYRLSGGWNFSDLPISKMYNPRANHGNFVLPDLIYSFNTVFANEFFAERYVTFMAGFRPEWNNKGRWSPRFTFIGKGHFGWINSSTLSRQSGFPVNSAEKGVFEAGVVVNRLFPSSEKRQLLNLLLRSFGIGVYYRLGEYAFDDWKRNIAVRFSFFLF